MKKFFKIVLVLCVVIGVGLVAVGFLTSGMTKSAEEFFMAAKNNNMDKAYTYLSDDFKLNTKKEQLASYLENNALDNYKEASWANRSMSGNRGTLNGSITNESGGVVPVEISFVKGSDGGWKIYSIQKPNSGIQKEPNAGQLPSDMEVMQLVSGSMNAFGASINAQSMAEFHNHISNLWQQQYTPESLEEVFKVFYGKGMDFTSLTSISPVMDNTPSINENGAFTISGYYPTQPNQVYFEQTYVHEGLGWKLAGFNIDVK